MWERDFGAKGRRVRGASGDGVGFRRSASTEGILNIVSIALFSEKLTKNCGSQAQTECCLS